MSTETFPTNTDDARVPDNLPTMTLTLKTLIERRLVLSTVIVSAVFYLLILCFMSMVFFFDIQQKWTYKTIDGWFEFEGVPGLSEEAKMQEQLKEVVKYTPGMYYMLYSSWQYFLVGIPLLTLVVGGILSLYRSITIAMLGLYHFIFCGLTFILVLHAILAVFISTLTLICRPL